MNSTLLKKLRRLEGVWSFTASLTYMYWRGRVATFRVGCCTMIFKTWKTCERALSRKWKRTVFNCFDWVSVVLLDFELGVEKGGKFSLAFFCSSPSSNGDCSGPAAHTTTARSGWGRLQALPPISALSLLGRPMKWRNVQSRHSRRKVQGLSFLLPPYHTLSSTRVWKCVQQYSRWVLTAPCGTYSRLVIVVGTLNVRDESGK